MPQATAERPQLKETPPDPTALPPIQRLPHELLQEIFLACLPDKRLPALVPDEAPMLLTRSRKLGEISL
ncbi:hypothetical protein NMY22_g7825 [Coprinellus aureogranulatus]|nr:hypothetical protein NMY22_g7825 [Coprinellus aureogranulatus]